ncbi:TPA: hypothetical protein JLJ58_000925 [Escherichia coli]|uniref:hypothetical protein n=1 Tax=Escherichia coli TaxID=562 RepID=UPI000BE7E95B|nr:hypothetical protein [Escherichia coli]EFH6051724.1 hypothetical protein [Escherichia coli]EKD4623248.1 hypothetical protein [Escherichia coli]EKE4259811.1 hypothetical protein [Escherichia coli]ELN1216480.1 hypothetical protein [Escherichia coli]HAW0533592.1 hypothetical protein [Escherichia coli]
MTKDVFFSDEGSGKKSAVLHGAQVTINPDSQFTKKIIRQTEVDVIVISDDKLHIILTNCLSKIASLNRWSTPLGILITLAVTMLTTNFKNFILQDSVWEAVFWVLIFFNIIWLVKNIPYRHLFLTVCHSIGVRKDKKRISDVYHIIDIIKQGDTRF